MREVLTLLVCHCMAVNEATLRDVIAAGAFDEFDVAKACGAGSVCGGCVPTVSRILDECRSCPSGAAEGRRTFVDAADSRS